MCDGFLNKKIQDACPDCTYHHPERKLPNVRKFTRKKLQILTPFTRWWAQPERSTLRVRIFLPEFFFLLLKDIKRITVTFFIVFLFLNQIRF
jgi:hypothetical protein